MERNLVRANAYLLPPSEEHLSAIGMFLVLSLASSYSAKHPDDQV